MTDHGDAATGWSLEQLANEVASLKHEVARLRDAPFSAQVESLRLGAGAPREVRQQFDDDPPAQDLEIDHPVSRRGALMALGAAAAGGAGLALGSAMVSAEPAAAANGDPLLLGEQNDSSLATRLINSGTGQGAAAFDVHSPAGNNALLGTVNGNGVVQPQPAGVAGTTDAPDTYGAYGASFSGDGVHGIAGNGSGIAQPGPAGVAGETNQTGTYGVYGASALKDGVHGIAGTPSGMPAGLPGPFGVSGESGEAGAAGVAGMAGGIAGQGVAGIAGGSSGFGVYGLTQGSATVGVLGSAASGTPGSPRSASWP